MLLTKEHKRTQGTTAARWTRHRAHPHALGVSLRTVIKISVTPAAKRSIEALAAKRGMTEQAVASRIYEWVAGEDEYLQLGILGQWPDHDRESVLRLALRKLGAAKKKRRK